MANLFEQYDFSSISKEKNLDKFLENMNPEKKQQLEQRVDTALTKAKDVDATDRFVGATSDFFMDIAQGITNIATSWDVPDKEYDKLREQYSYKPEQADIMKEALKSYKERGDVREAWETLRNEKSNWHVVKDIAQFAIPTAKLGVIGKGLGTAKSAIATAAAWGGADYAISHVTNKAEDANQNAIIAGTIGAAFPIVGRAMKTALKDVKTSKEGIDKAFIKTSSKIDDMIELDDAAKSELNTQVREAANNIEFTSNNVAKYGNDIKTILKNKAYHSEELSNKSAKLNNDTPLDVNEKQIMDNVFGDIDSIKILEADPRSVKANVKDSRGKHFTSDGEISISRKAEDKLTVLMHELTHKVFNQLPDAEREGLSNIPIFNPKGYEGIDPITATNENIANIISFKLRGSSRLGSLKLSDELKKNISRLKNESDEPFGDYINRYASMFEEVNPALKFDDMIKLVEDMPVYKKIEKIVVNGLERDTEISKLIQPTGGVIRNIERTLDKSIKDFSTKAWNKTKPLRTAIDKDLNKLEIYKTIKESAGGIDFRKTWMGYKQNVQNVIDELANKANAGQKKSLELMSNANRTLKELIPENNIRNMVTDGMLSSDNSLAHIEDFKARGIDNVLLDKNNVLESLLGAKAPQARELADTLAEAMLGRDAINKLTYLRNADLIAKQLGETSDDIIKALDDYVSAKAFSILPKEVQNATMYGVSQNGLRAIDNFMTEIKQLTAKSDIDKSNMVKGYRSEYYGLNDVDIKLGQAGKNKVTDFIKNDGWTSTGNKWNGKDVLQKPKFLNEGIARGIIKDKDKVERGFVVELSEALPDTVQNRAWIYDKFKSQPIIEDGLIKGYNHKFTRQEKEALFLASNDIADILPFTLHNVMMRVENKKILNEIIERLSIRDFKNIRNADVLISEKQMKTILKKTRIDNPENLAIKEKLNKEYIRVDSLDILPSDVANKIGYIHKDFVDDIVGYRKAMLTDTNSNYIVQTMDNALRYAMNFFREAVTVKNPVVLTNAIIGNQIMQIMNGIPAGHAFKKTLQATKEINKYHDEMYKLYKAKSVMSAEDIVNGNWSKEFIDAYTFIKSSIVGEAINDGVLKSLMDDGLWKRTHHLKESNPLIKAAKELYLAQGSKSGDMIRTMHDYSDMTARLSTYLYYRELGYAGYKAAKISDDLFVNYNKQLPKTIRAMRDYSVMPFATFYYRLPPKLIKQIKEHPSRALAMLVMYESLQTMFNDASYRHGGFDKDSNYIGAMRTDSWVPHNVLFDPLSAFKGIPYQLLFGSSTEAINNTFVPQIHQNILEGNIEKVVGGVTVRGERATEE